MLLRVGKECKVGRFYGQEQNATTYNLARMNMLLHAVAYQYFVIVNGDTLEHPAFDDMEFDAVVSNPPYSANWLADPKFLQDDRFSAYGKLAPKSKADYAFVQHMIYHLKENGTMAVVLPHGVLFRGAAEEQIRKVLVKDRNALDAVIGLPANLFFGTGIATCILVFKRNRNGNSGNILFIDASNDFEKGKNQNILRDKDIEKIIETYKNRKEIKKYSHAAAMDEIKENGYNLNIARYVDTFEEDYAVDIQGEFQQIADLKVKSQALDDKIHLFLKDLGL